jgi:hypothetical protein
MMDERRLEEVYRDLAAGDAERAPSFASVMGRAQRPHGVRLPVAAAVGLAAVAALFVVLWSAQKTAVSSAREPAPPLDFLLQDGRIAGVPAFDLEPRTALSRSVPPGFE